MAAGWAPGGGATVPEKLRALTDEREAVPARPHLLHLLPGFSPHEQGERGGSRDCAWAASRAGHVTEAGPGWLVLMGTARNPTHSPFPRNFVSDPEDYFQEEDAALRTQSLGFHLQHSHCQLLEGGGRRSLRPAWDT